MEQVMELLKAMQEKMDANLKEIKEDIKKQPRRNAGQNGSPSRMDDGQDGLPAKENGGLSRKDEGPRSGGKFRGN
jgi:hypothetical protein